MTADDGTRTGTRHPVRRDLVARWALVAAVVLVAVAAVDIGTWGNRWYVAEQVFAPHAEWEQVAELLRSANERLLDGLTRLAAAGACVGVALLARRGRR